MVQQTAREEAQEGICTIHAKFSARLVKCTGQYITFLSTCAFLRADHLFLGRLMRRLRGRMQTLVFVVCISLTTTICIMRVTH